MAARFAIALMGLVVALTCASCTAATRRFVATDLCTLAAHPEQFNHKLVRVRGLVGSDGIERTGLMDESCPTMGMALSISYEDGAVPGADDVFKAIYREGAVGTIGKRITATITGIFLSHPGQRPPRKLIVKSVSELQVVQKK